MPNDKFPGKLEDPGAPGSSTSEDPDGLNFAGRLRSLMMAGESQAEFARRVGISPSGLKAWLSGSSVPGMDNLLSICRGASVEISWLATGRGPMRAGEPELDRAESTRSEPAPAAATDGRLMGRLTEGIMRVFKEVGQAAAVRQVVERAAEYHDRIVARTTDPEDRLVMIGECLEQLRHELKSAATDPTQTKHSA